MTSATYQDFLQASIAATAANQPLLYRGVANSPFLSEIPNYPQYLQEKPDGLKVVSGVQNSQGFSPFPVVGQLPSIDAEGLNFLHGDITEACVCVATWRQGQFLVKWLGRNALRGEELWSSTKIIPLAHLVAQMNRRYPRLPVGQCAVRGLTTGGQFRSYATDRCFVDLVSYGNTIAASNALGAMFKRFCPQNELESWLMGLTGNQQLMFRGRYGIPPFIDQPEIIEKISSKKLLSPDPQLPQWKNNTVSVYDICRMFAMVGWHHYLDGKTRIPGAQWHSLQSLVTALAHDPSRWTDLALDRLGVRSQLIKPVIISKLGNGVTTIRDRTEVVYSGLCQFIDTRSRPHRWVGISFCLRGANQRSPRDPRQEKIELDARIATEFTAIIDHTIKGTLTIQNPALNLDRPLLQLGSGVYSAELRPAVKTLQTLLQKALFLDGTALVDGLFGKKTEFAVKAFQAHMNLTVDGIVGRQTWVSLDDYLVKQARYPQLQRGSGIDTPALVEPVKALQTLLQTHGFLPETAAIDGLFGRTTEGAVKTFQRAVLLPDSGVVNLQTWQALENYQPPAPPPEPPPALQLGSGLDSPQLLDRVKALQTLLQTKGFLPPEAAIDGLFGAMTENAVKAFQSAANLTVDGIVGEKTWEALENYQPPQPESQRPVLQLGAGMDSPELRDSVRLLQTWLQEKQFLAADSAIDGFFGKMTESAVKVFQKTTNLVANGIVEQSTWQALEAYTPPVVMPGEAPTGDRPVLKLGSGLDTPELQEDVKALQMKLQDLEFLSSVAVIDGFFGANTENAVKNFQFVVGLPQDGVVTAAVWSALETYDPKPTYSTLALGDGDRTPLLRNEVKVLQKILKEKTLLSPVAIVDGLFGPKTEAAVKTFQQLQGVEDNGTVDDLMWQSLQSYDPGAATPILKLHDGQDTPHLRIAVRRLQVGLKQLGYLPQTLMEDGLFGTQTDSAVRQFQNDRQLTVDGQIGVQDWQILIKELAQPVDLKTLPQDRPYPVLTQGDGEETPSLQREVKILQTLLHHHGFVPTPAAIDGLFGKVTTQQVIGYQQQQAMAADGIVGGETWARLLGKDVPVYKPVRRLNSQYTVGRLVRSLTDSSLRNDAARSLPLILAECERYFVLDRGQVAYILATARHESFLGRWMEEIASGEAYEGRLDLGNTETGDGVKYKGRGFVQITGRLNYSNWSKILDLDLITYPEKASEYEVAAKILILGMVYGNFTGYSLEQFIQGSRQDFYGARKIINGLDRAELIADYGRSFLGVL